MDITVRSGTVTRVDPDSYHVVMHHAGYIMVSPAAFWSDFPNQVLPVGAPVDILFNSSGYWIAVRPQRVSAVNPSMKPDHNVPTNQYLQCWALPQLPAHAAQGIVPVYFGTPTGYGDPDWVTTEVKTSHVLLGTETKVIKKDSCQEALVLVTGDNDSLGYQTDAVRRFLPQLPAEHGGYASEVYPCYLVNRQGEPLFQKGKRIR